MFDGLFPIVVGALTLTIFASATRQIWKRTKLSVFIPWLLIAAFMLYAAYNVNVLVSLGESVWKISSNLITHVNVPPKK